MSAFEDIIPTTKLTPNDGGTEYLQPIDTVVDVSPFTEGALVTTIQNMTGSGTVTIAVETSIENRSEHYMELANVVDLTAVPGAFPQQFYTYLAGSSDASSTPGFARFLRAKVIFGDAGDSLTMGIKAVLKP